MAGKKSSDRELFWRDVLKRQATSDLSIRKFCEIEGVSQPSFYAWRRRLQEQGSPRNELVGGNAFIPLKVLDATATLEVVHPHGCQVRISGMVDVVALKREISLSGR